ncbi:MAG: glycosyltransferase family 2 protein [bacterium]
MDLSIIIVNYNTTEHLSKNLDSIFYSTKNLMYEIIVVDNNSSDKEIEKFPLLYPKVKFFFRNSNDGFGAACNYGSKHATGKYFLFVNPDIIFENYSLVKIFGFMESNENVALSSGVLYGEDGSNVYTYNYFPDIKWEFTEALGKGSERKIKKLLSNEKIILKHSEALEVDWVMGAFMFIIAKVFKKIGRFDETFFLYYEDIDLQRRIKNSGYKIVVLPFVKIFHLEKSSVKNSEGENIYYFHMNRSKMIYFYKHFSFVKRNFTRLMFIVGYFFRFITLPFRKIQRKRETKILPVYFNIKDIFFHKGENILLYNK